MELKNVIDKIRVIDGGFPREDLELLLANREEAVPLLIEALDDVYDQWEEAIDEEYFIQIYAMYILGEFKAKEACNYILRYADMPTYYLHAILDDLVTERYSAILYQCFDGNVSWLDRMIHEDMDPYARLALLDVIIHHYVNDLNSRTKAMEYLESIGLDHDFIEESEDLAEHIVSIIIDYKFYELKDMVRGFFDSELIDPTGNEYYDDFIDEIYSDRVLSNLITNPEIDAIKELEKWACFDSGGNESFGEKKLEELRRVIEEAGYSDNNIKTVKVKKIGRNDPCPCGSGKKYKKCCLNKELSPDDTSFMEKDMERWLGKYPTVDRERGTNEMLLTDHYDREAIEIDKYVYLALHRRVPLDEVDCDEKELERRQKIYLKKAKELLELKMDKDGIDSYKEYDERNMIHYKCEEWINGS